MAKLLVATCIIAAFIVPTGIATAADSSVSGKCTIQGTVTYGKPLTDVPQDNTYDTSASALCNGTVDGQPISNVHIAVHVTGSLNGSCGSARSTSPGSGTLTWDRGTADPSDDVSVGFSEQFTVTGTEASLTYQGQRFGSAVGHATFATSRTPRDVAAQCAVGGVKELPFDGDTSTSSPLVSGPLPAGTLSAGLALRPQSPRDVLHSGLRVAATASQSAECALVATVSRGTATKLHLKSTKLGSGRASIPPGGGSAVVTIKLTPAAGRMLRKVRSVTMTVRGTIVGSAGAKKVSRRVTLLR